MKHYSEHILDLYVRNGEQIADERTKIELHLSQCASCRAVADDLRKFYQLAESSRKQIASHTESEDSLIVQPEYIRFRPLTKVRIPNSLPLRVWHFAKRRPFVSTVTMFSIAVLMILSIKQFTGISNTNPQFFDYYTEKKQIAVFNNQQQLLWTLSVKDLGVIEQRDLVLHHAKNEILLDINGDGKNELLTTRFLLTQQSNDVRTLHVINSDGVLQRNIDLPDKEIHFRSLKYNEQFEPTFLYFDSTSQSLVVAASNRRSPWLLIRYDKKFTIIGKYWHYGGIHFSPVDINNDGKKEIALYGKDDVDDVALKDFAFLTLLDPAMMTGETEATTTRGFGFPSSPAELLSIRFPSTDVNKAINVNPYVGQIGNETQKGLYITVSTTVSGSIITLEYYFSKFEQRITDVKWNTGYESYHKKLKDEGKLFSTFNKQYLLDLVANVEYWDGHEWRNKPKIHNN